MSMRWIGATILLMAVSHCAFGTSEDEPMTGTRLFRTYTDGLFGLVSSTGQVVVQPKYADMELPNREGFRYATYPGDGYVGVLLGPEGNELSDTPFLRDVDWLTEGTPIFWDGREYEPVMTESNRSTSLDISGQIGTYVHVPSKATTPKADKEKPPSNPSAPNEAVKQSSPVPPDQAEQISQLEEVAEGVFISESNGLVRLVDAEGQILIRDRFESVRRFREGSRLLLVEPSYSVKGLLSLSNLEYVVEPKYKMIHKWSADQELVRAEDSRGCIALFDYDGNETLSAAEEVVSLPGFGDLPKGYGVIKNLAGKKGLITSGGAIQLQCKYEDIGYYSEGLVPAKVNSQWGYVDVEGNWIIPPTYGAAGSFSHGLASVKSGKKYGCASIAMDILRCLRSMITLETYMMDICLTSL